MSNLIKKSWTVSNAQAQKPLVRSKDYFFKPILGEAAIVSWLWLNVSDMFDFGLAYLLLMTFIHPNAHFL